MVRFGGLLGAIALSFILSASQPAIAGSPALEQSYQQLFKDNANAVVLIRMVDSSGETIALGSGFIVDSAGVIVTNHHVIEPEPGAHLAVKVANGDVYDDVWVIHDDPRRDFAVLHIKASGLPVTKLGDLETVEVGQQVVALGNPLGLELTFTAGIVSSIRVEADHGYRFIQHQAPVSTGSSGGPLINMHGEVIGINTFFFEGGQNLNGAVPVDYVKAYIHDTPQLSYEQYARLLAPEAPAPPAQPKPHSVAWKTYRSEKFAISFRFPETWQFVEDAAEDGSAIVFRGTIHSVAPLDSRQTLDALHVTVQVTTSKEPQRDLEKIAHAEFETAQRTIASQRKLIRNVSTEFFQDDGYSGYYWLFDQGRGSLVGFAAALFTTTSRYELHGTCYSWEPLLCARTFEEIFDSFDFPKPPGRH